MTKAELTDEAGRDIERVISAAQDAEAFLRAGRYQKVMDACKWAMNALVSVSASALVLEHAIPVQGAGEGVKAKDALSKPEAPKHTSKKKAKK